MKKILCLILCLISIVSCCSMTISAATEDSSRDVMEELSGMTIDGKKFDEADYPKDSSKKEMSIIAVVESGFEDVNSSSNFTLVIYVYNPSCMKVSDSIENGINIGAGVTPDFYNTYRLKGASNATDYRFMKFIVAKRAVDVSTLYKNQSDDENRVYHISTLFLKVDGDVKSFFLEDSFSFSGSGDDVTCNRTKFDALEVELHATNWISPNAGAKTDGSPSTIYDHYEINSVYFAVPNSYFADNTDLVSILASFDRIRLTPFIIGRPSMFASGEG